MFGWKKKSVKKARVNEGFSIEKKLSSYRDKVNKYKNKRLRLREAGANENKINEINDIIGHYRFLIRSLGGKI